MAAPMPVTEERLIAGRKLRVAVGNESTIVELEAGAPWPTKALGRLDLLIRNGYVIRWDEQGELDPRSWPFARRLGIPYEPSAPVRGFLARARAREQMARSGNRRIRVFAGRPDGVESELFITNGKAFPLFRGAADSLAALEACWASTAKTKKAPRRPSRPDGKRRRRRNPKE